MWFEAFESVGGYRVIYFIRVTAYDLKSLPKMDNAPTCFNHWVSFIMFY